MLRQVRERLEIARPRSLARMHKLLEDLSEGVRALRGTTKQLGERDTELEQRQERDVPFRRNTALVFLNSHGAHGAFIPEHAEPADLQRYIYQFRIGPTKTAIQKLVAMLPEERRPAWEGKLVDYLA